MDSSWIWDTFSDKYLLNKSVCMSNGMFERKKPRAFLGENTDEKYFLAVVYQDLRIPAAKGRNTYPRSGCKPF